MKKHIILALLAVTVTSFVFLYNNSNNSNDGDFSQNITHLELPPPLPDITFEIGDILVTYQFFYIEKILEHYPEKLKELEEKAKAKEVVHAYEPLLSNLLFYKPKTMINKKTGLEVDYKIESWSTNCGYLCGAGGVRFVLPDGTILGGRISRMS